MRGVDVAEVHIVLATYNGEKYIREQLDSILENTFQDVMVEICDDGSTDSTLDIVREYVGQYDQISLYQNKKTGIYEEFSRRHQTEQEPLYNVV